MNLKEPIFITGYPRSGTTLLQCMLSAHSHLFSLPETHFFSEVMNKLCKPADATLTDQDVCQAFKQLQKLMNIEDTFFDKFLTAKGENSVTGKQLFEFVINHFRPGSDSDNSLKVVEKTPMHALFVHEILQVYLDARFIHIVRDPRDSISSTMNLPMNRSKWLPFYISSWRQVIQKIKAETKLKPNSIFTLRYEDLVSNPVQILQEICQFLKLHYEVEMISNFSNQYEGNVVGKSEYWKKDVKSGTVNIYKSKWRERITEAQAWLIEVEVGNEMAEYRYPRLSSPLLRDKIGILWQSVKTAREERRQLSRWIRHFLRKLVALST
ncbi:MAG: sulfotransferase [Candidatus Brocadiaceae bacterium]|nr:sulfotransferase [Candidatus Brocadiaceae bacterium]